MIWILAHCLEWLFRTMRDIFKKGDQKIYKKIVTQDDVATFNGKNVHPVCSTFALARDIEWSSRLFVLEMKEEDEEGIGTLLTIEHKSPALVGEEIEIIATVFSLEGNELICNYEAKVGKRRVAVGKTGQKVLKKEKVTRLFSGLKSNE